jgi:hypothetical protein
MVVNATGAGCRVGTKGAPVDIAAMLLWIVTAGAGVYLLAARPATAGEATAGEAAAGEAAAEAVAPATVPPSRLAQYGIPQAAVDAMAAGARVPPITHTRITTQPGQHPLLEFMHPALGIIGLASWIAYVVTRYGTFAWVSFGVLLVTITAGLTWYTINSRHARRSSAPAEMLETAGAPGTAGVLVTPEAAEAHEERGSSGGAVSGDAGAAGAGAGDAGAGDSGAKGRRYPPRRILVHGSGASLTLILAIITLLVSVHT